ncbi:MAG: hypothetical protein PUG16_07055 [Lachnospiraceae bacterium]|nr:hypothetical protein [Lachnospiraceae bacterium]
MAKNMKEAEGFNNMFASLGFGIDTKAKNNPKDSEHSRDSEKSDKDQKKTSETVPVEKKTTKEEKKADAKAEQSEAKKEKSETKTDRNSTKKAEGKASLKTEEKAGSPDRQAEADRKPSEKKEAEDRQKAAADQASKAIDSKDRIDSSEADNEKTHKTGFRQPAPTENSDNENTSVRLYARNKRYFEIRAAQLGVSQMEYINFLLEEEEKREAEEDLDPFSIELPKKESTSIKALVLTKHNMEFLRSASANLGMKMTQFINWMLDNERKMEKENGPRQSIDKWSAIQSEEQ